MKFSYQLSTLLLFLSLVSCGGGDDGDKAETSTEVQTQTPAPAQVGVLVDSPVQGVEYQSASYNGFTNEKGEYLYKEGEVVRFFIGNIALGEALATGILTPVDLTGSATPESKEAVNLLVLLQSLDDDANPENGITISPTARENAKDSTLNIFDEDAFNKDVVSLIKVLKDDQSASVVNDNDAITHFLAEEEKLAADNVIYCSVRSDYESIFGSPTDNCQERRYRNTYVHMIETSFVTAEVLANKENMGTIDSSQIARETVEMMLNVDSINSLSARDPKGVLKTGAKIATGELFGSLFPNGNGEFASIINNTLWTYAEAPACVAGDKLACSAILKNSMDQAYKAFTDFRYSYFLNNGIEHLNEIRIAREYMRQYTAVGLNLNRLSTQLGISSLTVKDQVTEIASKMQCSFGTADTGCVDGIFSEHYETRKVLSLIEKASAVMLKENPELLWVYPPALSDAWIPGVVFDQYSSMRSDIANNSAILAAMAYQTPLQIEAFLYDHGLKLVDILGDGYLDHEGFIASQTLNGKTHYILSLRGTDTASLQDVVDDVIKADLNALPKSSITVRKSVLNFSGEELHTGFANYARLSVDSIKDDVFDAIKTNPAVDVTIVGHSLGGAASRIVGMMFSKLYVPHDKFQIYTIAAPAVTKKKPDAHNRIRAFGFEEYQDIVTVSASSAGYQHIGVRYLFGIRDYISFPHQRDDSSISLWSNILGADLISNAIDVFDFYSNTVNYSFSASSNIGIGSYRFYGAIDEGYHWDNIGARNGTNHSSQDVYVPLLSSFSASSEGLSFNANSNIAFSNSPPIALPWITHAYTVNSGQTLLISAEGISGLLNGIVDTDGDRLTIMGVTLDNDTDGTFLEVNAGEWLFTPSPGFSGTVAFNYSIGDGIEGMSNSGSIEVVPPLATGISLTPAILSLKEGSEEQLTVLALPVGADDVPVSWTSSAPAVATVSSTGIVNAVAAGSATITATASDGGFTAISTVAVTASIQNVATIADASLTEGNSGSTNLDFTVILSSAAVGDVNVNYTTSDGSATAGIDYTARSGTLTIPSGSMSGSISIPVSGDTDVESDESFTVTLTNPQNAMLGKLAVVTGNILNDDSGTITPLNIPLDLDHFNTISCGNYLLENNQITLSGVGRRQGNGITSISSFNFKGSDTYIKWKAGTNSSYAGYMIYLSGLPYEGYNTTNHSYGGSSLIANDTWYYTHLKMNDDGSYFISRSKDNYDDNGGVIIRSKEGVLTADESKFINNTTIMARMADNYAGTQAELVIGEIKTTAIEIDKSTSIIASYNFDQSTDIPEVFTLTGAWDISTGTSYDGSNTLHSLSTVESIASISTSGLSRISFKYRTNISTEYKLFYTSLDKVFTTIMSNGIEGCWLSADIPINNKTVDVFEFNLTNSIYSNDNAEVYIDDVVLY